MPTDDDNRADYFSPILGRRVVKIDGVEHLAATVAWTLATGEQPIGEIIHIDGDVNNLRFDNLRDSGKPIGGTNPATTANQ